MLEGAFSVWPGGPGFRRPTQVETPRASDFDRLAIVHSQSEAALWQVTFLVAKRMFMCQEKGAYFFFCARGNGSNGTKNGALPMLGYQ